MRLSRTAPDGIYLCGDAPCIGQGLEESLRRTLTEQPGIRLVIIDTLQKVRAPQQYSAAYGSDYQEIAALKALADELQVCLLFKRSKKSCSHKTAANFPSYFTKMLVNPPRIACAFCFI